MYVLDTRGEQGSRLGSQVYDLSQAQIWQVAAVSRLAGQFERPQEQGKGGL